MTIILSDSNTVILPETSSYRWMFSAWLIDQSTNSFSSGLHNNVSITKHWQVYFSTWKSPENTSCSLLCNNQYFSIESTYFAAEWHISMLADQSVHHISLPALLNKGSYTLNYYSLLGCLFYIWTHIRFYNLVVQSHWISNFSSQRQWMKRWTERLFTAYLTTEVLLQRSSTSTM